MDPGPNILYIMADQLAAPQLKMYNPESPDQDAKSGPPRCRLRSV